LEILPKILQSLKVFILLRWCRRSSLLHREQISV